MTNPGIQYFNDRAEELARQYNALDRRKVHAELLALLPENRTLNMLDIGAGSGADAAMFAEMGHRVTACEPADNFRTVASNTFNNKNITWNADALPELLTARGAGIPFDIVIAGNVLQYLDEEGRAKSLERILSLVDNSGLVSIQYPRRPSREHQFCIPDNEIINFVGTLNKQNDAGMQFKTLVDKSAPDLLHRKNSDGTTLLFHILILRREK